MKITVLGSGNMACFMATRLRRAGHLLYQIYGRNKADVEALSYRVNAQPAIRTEDVLEDADVYIYALPDDVLPGFAARFGCPGKIAIHCSGALPAAAIAAASALQGVIWPVYSIRKNNLPDNNAIPLIIEGSTPAAVSVVNDLASGISTQIYSFSYEKRQWLHLAAVMSNNFINHLLAVVYRMTAAAQVPYAALLPIIEETFALAKAQNPANSQTGPAIRHDMRTIERHLALLEHHPEWQRIYTMLTDSIQQLSAAQKS